MKVYNDLLSAGYSPKDANTAILIAYRVLMQGSLGLHLFCLRPEERTVAALMIQQKLLREDSMMLKLPFSTRN